MFNQLRTPALLAAALLPLLAGAEHAQRKSNIRPAATIGKKVQVQARSKLASIGKSSFGKSSYGGATIARHRIQNAVPKSYGKKAKFGANVGITIGGGNSYIGGQITIGKGYHAPQKSYHAPHKIWVPGHYETVQKKVWVGGHTEKIWVDPIYATHYDECGVPYQVQVSGGCWKLIEHPGYWDVQTCKVYQPGCWKTTY